MKTIDGDIYDDDADIDTAITIDIDIDIDEDTDDNEDDCSVIEVPRPILIINWWLADISSLLSWNNMFGENDETTISSLKANIDLLLITDDGLQV